MTPVQQSLDSQRRHIPMQVMTHVGGACIAHTDGVRWQQASSQDDAVFVPAAFPTSHDAFEAMKAAEFLTDQLVRRLRTSGGVR
jgi:hypothetical protein